MATSVTTFIRDAIGTLVAGDTSLTVVKVFSEDNTNLEPIVYPYVIIVNYPSTYESGGSMGIGIASCGILATQKLALDTTATGAAAQAASDLVSKIQHRLWDVDCETIATHTDAKFTARVVGLQYHANDGHFDNKENIVRIGITLSVTIAITKV